MTLPILFTPGPEQSLAINHLPLPKPTPEEMRELWQSYYEDCLVLGCTPRECIEYADWMTV